MDYIKKTLQNPSRTDDANISELLKLAFVNLLQGPF